jgi:hypothetical protein
VLDPDVLTTLVVLAPVEVVVVIGAPACCA